MRFQVSFSKIPEQKTAPTKEIMKISTILSNISDAFPDYAQNTEKDADFIMGSGFTVPVSIPQTILN